MLRSVYIVGIGILLGALALGGCQSEPEIPSVLTDVGQVGWAWEEEGKDAIGRPVRLEGVVTYADPAWGSLFIQDEMGGIYIGLDAQSQPGGIPSLHAGQRVKLQGVVASSDVGLDSLQIQTLGDAPFPEPQRHTITELETKRPISQWVQVSGVVRRAEVQDDRLALTLSDGSDELLIRVRRRPEGDPQSLVGAEVRIRGVCAWNYEFQTGKRRGIQLFVASLDQMEVQTAVQEVPVQSISRIVQNPSAFDKQRVRVQGTVRKQEGGTMLLVGDTTGTIRVQPTQHFDGTRGDRINLVGFVSTATGQIHLRDAVVRARTGGHDVAPDKTKPPASLPVLTTVKAVHRLSHEEAQREYPARIEGVVTYADPEWELLFIQDRTAGIYVALDSISTRLTIGRRVRIEGTVMPGLFAHSLRGSQVRFLGKGTLPPDPNMALRHFFAGRADAQWVGVSGTVQAHRDNWGQQFLTVDTGIEQFEAQIPPRGAQAGVPDRLIGAEVRVRGVGGTLVNDRQQIVSTKVFVPRWEFIDIREPGPSNVYAVPRQPIRSLLRFSGQDEMRQMVRIEGTVTHRTQDGDLYVQDETGAIRVKVKEGFAGSPAQPGDRVEAVGFEAAGAYNPVLENARYRTTGTTETPSSMILTAENLLNGRYADRLVRIEGELLNSVTIEGKRIYTMRTGEHVYKARLNQAVLPDSLASMEAGSRLRLLGIYELQADETGGGVTPQSFDIHLRSPADVAVVEPAPWWSWWHTLGLLGGMAVLVLGAGSWGVALRRQVQKQTEFIREKLEALRRVNSDLKNLLASTDVGTLFLDRELRVQRYTPRVEDLFDVGPGDEGRPITDLPRHVEYDELEADAQRVLRDLDTVEREVETENGEWFLVRLRPYRTVDDEIEGVGITFIDVTERRQLEAQVRRTHRMKTVGTLAGGIAHEFNNLLHTVSVYLEIAQEEISEGHVAREFLARIERGIGQAEMLANKLLTFSRPNSTTVHERIEVAPLVQEALDLASSSLSDDLRLDARLDEESVIIGDPDQFRQVVLNLVTNAGWMAEGADEAESMLEVQLQRAEVDENAADGLPSLDSGSYVHLSVRSPGVEVSEEARERVFDPFFTLEEDAWTSAPKQGTGLGLSVAYSAVEAHGGKITVRSDEGEGTTFDVYLPAAPPDSSSRPEIASASIGATTPKTGTGAPE